MLGLGMVAVAKCTQMQAHINSGHISSNACACFYVVHIIQISWIPEIKRSSHVEALNTRGPEVQIADFGSACGVGLGKLGVNHGASQSKANYAICTDFDGCTVASAT